MSTIYVVEVVLHNGNGRHIVESFRSKRRAARKVTTLRKRNAPGAPGYCSSYACTYRYYAVELDERT